MERSSTSTASFGDQSFLPWGKRAGKPCACQFAFPGFPLRRHDLAILLGDRVWWRDDQSENLTRLTSIRRVLKNPLNAPGYTFEVGRHRVTTPSMSRD